MRLVNALRADPRRICAAIAAALVVAVVAITATSLVEGRRGALAQARNYTETLVSTASEHIARTFESINRALEAAVDAHLDFEAGRYGDGLQARQRAHEVLRSIQHGSAALTGIAWIDREGQRVAASTVRDAPPLNIRGQAAFDIHLERDNVEFFISPPYRSPVTGAWVVAVSRRLFNDHGDFAGVAIGGLNLTYLIDAYGAFERSLNGVVSLYLDNGAVLLQGAETRSIIGSSDADTPLFRVHLPQASAGTFSDEDDNGNERLVSYRRVAGFPLVVAVAIEERTVLAAWQRSSAIVAIFALVLVCGIVGGAWAIARALERNAKVQRDITRAAARAEAANRAKSDFLAMRSARR